MITFVIEVLKGGRWREHRILDCPEEKAVEEVNSVRQKFPAYEFRLLVDCDAPLDERFVD